MRKGEATREAIVGEALAQCTRVGLDGLSLGVLASSLALSKSGLFAHFRSKEALQLAVLEEAIARFRARVIVPSFAAEDGKRRLEALFRFQLDWIRGEAGGHGCPFVVIAQELEMAPPKVRDRFVASQVDWRKFLCLTVEAGIAKKEFASGTDPKQVAFEFGAIALGFQQLLKLGDARAATRHAKVAFEVLMDRTAL